MKKRILVIDDDEELLHFYRLMLEDEGYNVFTAYTVYETPEEVKRIQPHVIILDIFVRKADDGWNFLQMLHSTPETASIPLILCSGLAQFRDGKLDALKSDTVDIVLKPFDIDELIQKVQKFLSKYDS